MMKSIVRLLALIGTFAFLFGCSDDEETAEPVNTTPAISDQTFTIAEDASIGTSLGTVVASDADGDVLTFSITGGNLGDVFSIDDTSGELTLAGTLNFDATSSYALSVQVADKESNATAIITVNVTEIEIETTVTYPQAPLSIAFDGSLVGADYWSEQPEILSASFGFADNIGLLGDEITEDLVREAGGSWLSDLNCTPENTQAHTISVTQDQLASIYIMERPYVGLKDGAIGVDGLPIVFSWPVLTNTIDLSDFQITLNTGEVLKPIATSPQPNWENNERNCVTIFGEWGNKKPSTDPESRFVTKVEIVADDTPLMLLGPNNQMVSAVGLTWENENNSSPYDENNGPILVGAKLNYVGQQAIGEGTNSLIFNTQNATLPNDEFALYGGGDFRLRMLTTGGFSPDGIRGVLPTDYERFFRIHANGENGETILIEKVGVDYQVMGGTLKVIGLSDLGRKEGNGVNYNDCYAEDRDNYIDVILVGHDAAARNITFLEIPSLEGGYEPFYNPGGPGTTPFDGELYSQPGPRDLEPVIIALDDPMRISN